MRAVLNTLIDELNRLKAAGMKNVSVSDEAMTALRTSLAKRAKTAPAPEPLSSLATPEKKAQEETPGNPPEIMPLVIEEKKPVFQLPKTQTKKLPPPSPFSLPDGDKELRWKWLLERVTGDAVCQTMIRPGKKIVLGVGNLDAAIMFVGEAPGAEEEIQGEPFVGPAGQLLTKIISATGLKREEVYIGNIMNWRPQLPVEAGGNQRGNREPTQEEMEYCLPFLRAQVEIVKPKILVALGSTAAKGLLGYNAFKTLGEVRGRWHEYLGTPLMVTYHPSYLLRRSEESENSGRKTKRTTWEDFMLVMEKVGMPVSEKQRKFFL